MRLRSGSESEKLPAGALKAEMHQPPCRTSSSVRLTGEALSLAEGIYHIAEPSSWDPQALRGLAHRPRPVGRRTTFIAL